MNPFSLFLVSHGHHMAVTWRSHGLISFFSFFFERVVPVPWCQEKPRDPISVVSSLAVDGLPWLCYVVSPAALFSADGMYRLGTAVVDGRRYGDNTTVFFGGG